MKHEVLDRKNREKLEAVKNNKVLEIVTTYAELCKPSRITVITDTPGDHAYIREAALKTGDEKRLAMEGHTVHFDSAFDQARDRANTKILVPKGQKLGKRINTSDREKGIEEIFALLEGIMKGKELFVCFFCLGPNNSRFSIPSLQLTDSAYVAHSESILYRPGYDEFKHLAGEGEFFHFVHSAGELDDRGNTKNIDKRRIYIDLEGNRVLTVNNQYAGNSVGLKKLALRLAIKKSNQEDWLCEHMFIMGTRPLEKERITYFTGAFPSACGKTSTAMIPGQTIIGDDIAYIKPGDDGRAYAANVEQGIFGIIQNVNPVDDALIYRALTTPRELIFSNVLINDSTPYWLGMGEELPAEGDNFTGAWRRGNKDAESHEILPAHKNARYTIRISDLENADENLYNPDGVPISGFIYGGRDSDTSPPVVESLSWAHGVFMGAALESETTSATLGKEGVRKHDPMANIDFLVIPLGTYIQNHLKFGDELDMPPKIFVTNYFLKENGRFLNEIVDKKIWLLWMEGRVHDEFEGITTPIGIIPRYTDLERLFKDVFQQNYTHEDYEQQFSLRTTQLLERLDRIEKIYREEHDVPEEYQRHIVQQRTRLLDARERCGKESIVPRELE